MNLLNLHGNGEYTAPYQELLREAEMYFLENNYDGAYEWANAKENADKMDEAVHVSPFTFHHKKGPCGNRGRNQN